MANISDERVFQRNRIWVVGLAVNAALFGLVGALYLIAGSGLGAIWLLGSALWCVNLFWSRAAPFMRMTRDEVAIYPAMARPPKIFKWEDIKELRREGKNRIHLHLRNGRAIKVSLASANKEDREQLIETLRERVVGAAAEKCG